MTPKRKSLAKLPDTVDAFNRRFPVGMEVMLRKDGVPEPVRTKTRSEAFVMGGHTVPCLV